MGRFTHEEKSNEATREAGRRRRVSAKLIDEGKMTKTEADRLVDLMDEIAEDYEGAHKRAGAKADKLKIALVALDQIINGKSDVGIAFAIASKAVREIEAVKP